MVENEIILSEVELPMGWVWKTIGDVCDHPQYGWTTSAAKKGNIKFLRTSDITSGVIDWKNVPYCEKQPDNLEKYLLKDGDIVISRAGSVGYSILLKDPETAVFASYLIRFRPKLNLNKKYFSYFLKSPSYWKEISEKKLGIAIPNVNATKLKNIPFPLSPIPEQERIVSKIEELFTQLDAAEAALKRAKNNLKRYKQSLVQSAVTGELTHEWREAHKNEIEPASKLLERIKAERIAKWETEIRAKGKDPAREKYKEPSAPDVSDLPELPEGWCWVNIDNLSDGTKNAIKAGPFGSSVKKEFYVSSGFKIYGQEQVIKQDPNFGDYYINKELFEKLKSCEVKPGDILISLVGTIGKVLILPDDIEPGIINPRLIKFSFDRRLINRQFFKHYIESEPAKQYFSISSHGQTMDVLNLGILRLLPIPLPSIEEQRQILIEIERIITIVEFLNQT